jgi:ribosomal protein S18 acetylase RimI-like enzyme
MEGETVIEIRRASYDDIPVLAAFQRDGWEHDYVGYAPEGVAALSIAQYGTPRALARQLRDYDIYDVAVDDGAVIGCICGLHDPGGEPEILWLHVSRSARGLGIGRMLVDSFIEQMPPVVERIYVTTFQDYQPTIAFYERLGFVEDTRYEELMGGSLLVRHLRMRLELRASAS